MGDLNAFQSRIAKHFAQRAVHCSAIGASVYFADHGLRNEDIPELITVVQDTLRKSGLAFFGWAELKLAFLVCTVEAGYDYEGNGTDFWPLLDHRLKYSFSLEERVVVSEWFEEASKKYGGVVPKDSDWDRAFCHITWPITHAIAAKDIRRPFADCLRRFYAPIDLDDSVITGDFRGISTSVGSRRFRTWLTREDVVAGIVRDLLGGPTLAECGLFSDSCRDRLILDLKNERDIVSAIRSTQAKRSRDATRVSKKSSLRLNKQDKTRFGNFLLCHPEDGTYELLGELPELPSEVRTALRAIRRKWQPRPWGFAGASILPSDTLRSACGTFELQMSEISRASYELPFFTSVDDLSLDAECISWLKSVRFAASERLVFLPIATGGETSEAITSPPQNFDVVWVLVKNGYPWPDVERAWIGETSDAELYEVVVSDPAVRDWLGWPSIRSDQLGSGCDFRWIFPTPVSVGKDGIPVFCSTDEVGVVALAGASFDLKLLAGLRPLDVATVTSSVLVNVDSPGNYELVVQKDERTIDAFSFAIIEQAEVDSIESDHQSPWRLRLAHSDAGVTVLSRSDLLNQRLVLDIEADRKIENVELVVSLNRDDSTVRVILPRIPTKLRSTHPMWLEVSKNVSPGLFNSNCDIIFSVTVADAYRQEWRLEPELTSIWWECRESCFPRALTDRGEFKARHQCLVTGKQIEEPKLGYPFISLAQDEHDSELLFDGRVGLVGDARLQVQLERPRRMLRQLQDAGDNPGLLNISKRYLALSSATSDSIVAEVNRIGVFQTLREWLISSLCGLTWMTALKQGGSLESVNPISLWWKTQLKYSDLVLPKIEQGRIIPHEIPDLVLREFSKALPTTWWDGVVADVSPDDAAAMEPLMRQLLSDEDIYIDEVVFTETLREANRLLSGSHLADLVIPVTGGDDLLQWTISECSLDELAESLFDWIRKFLKKGRGRQSWSKEELHCYLNLLLYPEQLRRTNWQSVLEKLIHDRPVARAGAFVAWRIEQNARLISHIDDLLQLKRTNFDLMLQESPFSNDGESSIKESEDY